MKFSRNQIIGAGLLLLLIIIIALIRYGSQS